MPKKVRITLEVTVRAFTKEERLDECVEAEDCRGAVQEFGANDLAETLAQYVMDDQDEILSGAMVKIKSCTATVTE